MKNPAATLFGNGTIIHPCNLFAKQAGYASWTEALEVMRGGVIVVGPAPHIGRTAINFSLFNDQVKKEGLTVIVDDVGRMAVGLRQSFPAETLDAEEREAMERISRVFKG